MLGIFLRILSILGIILLVLLALLIGGVFLVLFFPVSYRVYGGKDGSGIRLTVKVRWLFGLVGIVGRYPEPGEIRVRALCFTLFRKRLLSSGEKEGTSEKKKIKKEKSGKRKFGKGRKKAEEAVVSGGGAEKEKTGPEFRKRGGDTGEPLPLNSGEKKAEPTLKTEEAPKETAGSEAAENEEKDSAKEQEKNSFWEKISSIREKIKYTFRGIYDKIKKIWENISYYAELLQKEEVKELLGDSLQAVGKILKSIRPRHIRADIRFGTGAPDTTGYLYGAYCMLAPFLGTGLVVTPDFEEAAAEGEFDLSGRITVWILLVNGLKMYKLIRRLSAGKKKSAEGLRNGGKNGR